MTNGAIPRREFRTKARGRQVRGPEGAYTYWGSGGQATGRGSGDKDRQMARYIDEILQPGEKVLYSTNAHWIFYLPAILAWIVAIGCLIASRMVVSDTPMLLWLSLAAIVAVAALYWTLRAWFHRWTTETDVTNLRVVHKTGFISRRTFEISVDKVASVDVIQSIPGRLLNYGDVTLETMGEAEQTIKTIAAPLAFRNSITAR